MPQKLDIPQYMEWSQLFPADSHAVVKQHKRIDVWHRLQEYKLQYGMNCISWMC